MMKFIKHHQLFIIAVFTISAYGCMHRMLIGRTAFKGSAYYMNTKGNDAGLGSRAGQTHEEVVLTLRGTFSPVREFWWVENK